MNPKERKLILGGAFLFGASILAGCDNVGPQEAEAAPKNFAIRQDFATPIPLVAVFNSEDFPPASQTPINIEEESQRDLSAPGLEEKIVAERFIMPLEGGVSRGWDYLEDVSAEGGERRFHAGIDINWPAKIDNLSTFTGNEDFGMPALSISDGNCVYARDSGGEYGNVVIMEYLLVNTQGEEEKIYSLYAHLDEILVEVGEVYRLGEEVGTVGRSGGVEFSHLHWEMFNEEHFNFILENGIEGFWSDLGYIERSHENPLTFIELHK